ncbi:heme ABC transporter ATP-binding protein [Flavobacterium sp.]|uniref:heme ABC transporter ATP-binding protein n=1 Tax=Flavobacterium sp. TaxID=239 RepID=UPI0035287792
MIVAHKISYAHKKVAILQNIDVAINYGELVVIVGPNGAGKSTLLSMLSNEMSDNEEPIFFKKKTFEEWDIQQLPLHKAKFSQQYSNDIPLTVEEVVLMGRYPYFDSVPTKADNTAVEKAMKETDVIPFAKRNYNTLSGGEKQRVHLARVLTQLDNDIAHKLLFLDEPLNNLDVLHQHIVLKSIRKFTQKGNTAIVVLHDLNLAAQFATHIIMMKKGKVFCQGKPADVFTGENISQVYNFPCTICTNPINQNPLILFGT